MGSAKHPAILRDLESLRSTSLFTGINTAGVFFQTFNVHNASSDTRYEKCRNPLRLEDVCFVIWTTSLFTSTRHQRCGHDMYVEFQVSADVLYRINYWSRPKNDRREQIVRVDGYRHGHGFIADSTPATVPMGVDDPEKWYSRLQYCCTQPEQLGSDCEWHDRSRCFVDLHVEHFTHSTPQSSFISTCISSSLLLASLQSTICHQASWPRREPSMSRIGQYQYCFDIY